jgi:hypothetical protein
VRSGESIVNQSLLPSSAGDARINCFKLDIVTLGALKTSIICLSRYSQGWNLNIYSLFYTLRRVQQQQPTTHISIISHTDYVCATLICIPRRKVASYATWYVIQIARHSHLSTLTLLHAERVKEINSKSAAGARARDKNTDSCYYTRALCIQMASPWNIVWRALKQTRACTKIYQNNHF